MRHYSLSALGVDKPGIVAAVSGVLADLGCNLEDSTMSILQGHFAILIVISAPEHLAAADVESRLSDATRLFDLVVSVRPLAESSIGAPGATEGEPWTISVHGADRTGIVHGVTKALADAGGNVVDLSTHLVGSADSPVYVMTLRVTLPAGERGEQAARSVARAGSELGVHCAAHRDELEVL